MNDSLNSRPRFLFQWIRKLEDFLPFIPAVTGPSASTHLTLEAQVLEVTEWTITVFGSGKAGISARVSNQSDVAITSGPNLVQGFIRGILLHLSFACDAPNDR